jgi:hypothetical protein
VELRMMMMMMVTTTTWTMTRRMLTMMMLMMTEPAQGVPVRGGASASPSARLALR